MALEPLELLQRAPIGMPVVHPTLRGPICGVMLGLCAAVAMVPRCRVLSEDKALSRGCDDHL